MKMAGASTQPVTKCMKIVLMLHETERMDMELILCVRGDLDMDFIDEDETLVVTVVTAIHIGDIPSLKRLLTDNPGLATARIIR